MNHIQWLMDKITAPSTKSVGQTPPVWMQLSSTKGNEHLSLANTMMTLLIDSVHPVKINIHVYHWKNNYHTPAHLVLCQLIILPDWYIMELWQISQTRKVRNNLLYSTTLTEKKTYLLIENRDLCFTQHIQRYTEI